MPPQPKRAFRHETTWIREYAKTYLPNEVGFSYEPQDLRDAGISIIGIRNIFRRGRVVYRNKLEGPGAVWIIEGDNNDEERFRLTVVVISESIAVSLMRAERVNERKVEDNNDAA